MYQSGLFTSSTVTLSLNDLIHLAIYFIFLVSGEANFAMSSTLLTVGGFTQPGVARTLIKMPANSEKGLSHRFLWLFPNPLFEKFDKLGEIDQDFVKKIGMFYHVQFFHTLHTM